MTFTVKQKHVNGYSLTIEQDKFSTAYEVRLARMIDECRAVDIDRKTYATREQANRRFYTLSRKIQDGGCV